jgi:lycopene cyclase domain-containing protein
MGSTVQYEYLIFNILVISGPLVFGSLRPFYFIDRWLPALISAVAAGTPYIIWDVLVTGRHWHFNPAYVSGLYIGGLPLEEWLFFITVPFACLFSWEMILRYSKQATLKWIGRLRPYLYIIPAAGVVLFLEGLEYTGLALIFSGLAVFADQILQTDLLLKRPFYLYLTLVIVFTVIFNGFLTARPVVLYGEEYQIGLRIFTIPVEDFAYGLSLIYLNTVVFERLKRGRLPYQKTED